MAEYDELSGFVKMANENIAMTDHYEVRVKGDSANFSLFYMKDSVFFKAQLADTSVTKLPIKEYETILVGDTRYELRLVATSALSKRTFHYLFKVLDGKISLYEFDDPYTNEPNYYLFNGAKLNLVSKQNFAKEMGDYFDKNKALSKQIKKGDKGYEDILSIVMEYNANYSN